MPTRALRLVAVICAHIGLITVGSTSAFFAVISLGALALYISCRTNCPIPTAQAARPAPAIWPIQSRRFGIPVNIFAICYCIFVIIWLPFPAMLPVTAANFNYAGPIMFAVIVIALIDWFVSGHKRFQVPTDPNKE